MSGIIGKKIGMTSLYSAAGKNIPCTVIEAGPCVVTQVRTVEKDGYSAVQLAFDEKKEKHTSAAMKGHFEKAQTTPKRKLVEFRDFNSEKQLGETITVELFAEGEFVDVVGTSKGKGFQGVVKRHGFSGLRASHGVQAKHRSPGSIGGCSTPGRTFRGMRMSGHMGTTRTTTPLLKVQGVDVERGLILIRGAVPGPKGSVVLVRTAAKGA